MVIIWYPNKKQRNWCQERTYWTSYFDMHIMKLNQMVNPNSSYRVIERYTLQFVYPCTGINWYSYRSFPFQMYKNGVMCKWLGCSVHISNSSSACLSLSESVMSPNHNIMHFLSLLLTCFKLKKKNLRNENCFPHLSRLFSQNHKNE